MSSQTAAWIVIVAAVFLANVPFVNQRRFACGPRCWPKKSLPARLFELGVLFVLTGLLAIFVETRVGPRYPQGWEFYVTSAALFVTFSFPGFVWQHLRRG
jgi:hypothetical protein